MSEVEERLFTQSAVHLYEDRQADHCLTLQNCIIKAQSFSVPALAYCEAKTCKEAVSTWPSATPYYNQTTKKLGPFLSSLLLHFVIVHVLVKQITMLDLTQMLV